MWGIVTRVPNILASHWSLSRNTRFWLADISGDLIARHLTPVARDEKSQVRCSQFTLTLASCLDTSKVNLNIIGSLFQGWHPYTWMIVRVTRWKVSANPPVRLVNPFDASWNRDFSFSRSRTYTGYNEKWSSKVEDVTCNRNGFKLFSETSQILVAFFSFSCVILQSDSDKLSYWRV